MKRQGILILHVIMNMITTGKPYYYKGTTITPLVPVPQDKSDELVDIEKRNNHLIVSFPESVQQRWESQIFHRLPTQPTLSPFRFRGKLCVFLNGATLYNEKKESITDIADGAYRGKLFFQFPSITEKDGDSKLTIKLVSLIIMNNTCPW